MARLRLDPNRVRSPSQLTGSTGRSSATTVAVWRAITFCDIQKEANNPPSNTNSPKANQTASAFSTLRSDSAFDASSGFPIPGSLKVDSAALISRYWPKADKKSSVRETDNRDHSIMNTNLILIL